MTSGGAKSDPTSAATGGRIGARVLAGLLLLVPATAVLDHLQVRGSVVFVIAVLAMIPVAGFLGQATEEISILANSAWGGLLNATFGNAVELLVGVRLLLGTEPDAPQIVRASIVGSIVTHLLLLIGASMFFGGLKYREQRFHSTAAGVSASLLIIAFAGMSLPTIFGLTVPGSESRGLSVAVSVTLALVYACGELFALSTHKHLYNVSDDLRGARGAEWTMGRAIFVLAMTTAATTYLAGVFERTIGQAGAELGLSKIFVGVVVVGLITNVGECLAAVSYARRNMMDLSFQVGSSAAIQIMLFVLPILVFVGAATGHSFSLQFTPFELASMLLPVLILNHLASDGVCNWLEGVQLMALYALIGTAFYFVP